MLAKFRGNKQLRLRFAADLDKMIYNIKVFDSVCCMTAPELCLRDFFQATSYQKSRTKKKKHPKKSFSINKDSRDRLIDGNGGEVVVIGVGHCWYYLWYSGLERLEIFE